MDLQTLSDKIEIAELLATYARAVDRKDWDLWRSVFTDDAHIDYRSAGGIEGDRETVARWLAETLASFPMTQHSITNIESDIERGEAGDTAVVHAMFSNPMQMPGVDGLSTCGGWYHHAMVRTPAGWRSHRLVEETAWFSNPPKGLRTP